MPHEADFPIALSIGRARIRVRFATDGPEVTSFMVQLEAFHMREWEPVRRYDHYHGRPHLDLLDSWGREYDKQWLDMDRKSALTFAIHDFKENGERYIIEFLKENAHE